MGGLLSLKLQPVEGEMAGRVRTAPRRASGVRGASIQIPRDRRRSRRESGQRPRCWLSHSLDGPLRPLYATRRRYAAGVFPNPIQNYRRKPPPRPLVAAHRSAAENNARHRRALD